ncbi:hypothetical protein ACWT_0356 [Actinoplanes sp. SE50]|uniref:hypothetical protein n=1 Tax=unclassified Actinoplanes TaxID=2626549 RepID=UPI00023EC3B5|nr:MULTISPECIES: hypothetical protein [unclassified Actinoplanes]AEV81368.1 hypothetical protein ACPL_471 [Actinoplanes sp. SE50/110]ATO79771.1 hypothetical protein ACWT_0356 [Actinoplanes sp. SE50]SLL97173.1 hypothetical protein ACSP50_0369 [Actinoplanes sp. SE50/110]
MRSHLVRAGLAVITGALVAGCGAAPAAVPTADPAPLPTLTRPVKPPRDPTDTKPNTGWLTGVVSRGGSGPCYGFTSDDGAAFALYNGDGLTLTEGARVQVKLESTLLKIYCGPGDLMAVTAAAPVG